MTGIFLACISSALPVYLFINGINYSDNLWFKLFVFEFLVLSSIYLLLTKINLKKNINHCYNPVTNILEYAKVAELVDAQDLGFCGVTRESSILSFRTI